MGFCKRRWIVEAGGAHTPVGSLGMSPEGYSERSRCEPFTATQAQRAPTPFTPPGAGEGGRPRPMGGGVYLFAHLLVVPTCLGKEDHLLGYHAGPKSQSS